MELENKKTTNHVDDIVSLFMFGAPKRSKKRYVRWADNGYKMHNETKEKKRWKENSTYFATTKKHN